MRETRLWLQRCVSQWCEAPQEERAQCIAQTNIMYVSERGIKQGQEKDSIHKAMRAKMQCCFRWYSLVAKLYPGHDCGFFRSGGCGYLKFSHSLTTAVCDSVFGSWKLRKCWCPSARFSKTTANLAAKISKVRSLCWQRRIR